MEQWRAQPAFSSLNMQAWRHSASHTLCHRVAAFVESCHGCQSRGWWQRTVGSSSSTESRRGRTASRARGQEEQHGDTVTLVVFEVGGRSEKSAMEYT
eukprot:2226352-Lingulodinium_polyedra.AAC.1